MGNIVLSAWSDLDVWLFDVISIPRAQVHTSPNFGEISSNIYEVQVWPKLCEIPFISFYRASICEGGLGSRNSVRSSVCLYVCLSHACIVTKLNDALQIFLYRTKGQWICYSATKSGWSAMPPSFWNLRSNWPTPFEKRRLRQISAYNISTVRDSEKVQLWRI